MAYFASEQEVYDTLGRLFVGMVDDDELFGKFRKSNTIVQYRFHDPDSQITVRMKEDEEPKVDLGATDLQPEVTMTMDADTAHRFWLGQVNVTVALARGQIKAKGPVAKVLRLVPLARPVFPRYEAQLKEQGREDLVEVA
jgi:putative sterol carrier protein